MKKFSHLLLAAFAAIMVGCSCPVDESVSSAAEVAGRVKDVWIDAENSAGVTLEENLLRSNIYIVFDCSGSMDGEKISVAKKAINKFSESIPEDTGLGLAIFDNSGLSERASLGVNNRPQFGSLVNMASAGGGTPLHEAVVLGYTALRNQAKKQLGYGQYHLVIVTDGDANPGHDPTRAVNQILADSPVVIHTIGFQIGERHALNRPGLTIYKDAQSPQDLAEGLQSVLAESDTF